MSDVMKVLEQVAAKLGVAVEYLWEILVRQKLAEGVTNLIVAGILLAVIVIICCVTPKIVKHYSNKYKELKDDRMMKNKDIGYTYSFSSLEENNARDIAQSLPIIVIVVTAILIPLMIAITITGVQKLINPEYFAIKEIMEAIGGTIG